MRALAYSLTDRFGGTLGACLESLNNFTGLFLSFVKRRKTGGALQLYIDESDDGVTLGGVHRRFRRWSTSAISSRGVRSAHKRTSG